MMMISAASLLFSSFGFRLSDVTNWENKTMRDAGDRTRAAPGSAAHDLRDELIPARRKSTICTHFVLGKIQRKFRHLIMEVVSFPFPPQPSLWATPLTCVNVQPQEHGAAWDSAEKALKSVSLFASNSRRFYDPTSNLEV